MSEPERRRRRPAVSCTLCRRRKVRCNRETPCSNCVRSRNGTCVYETLPSLTSQQHLGDGQTTDSGRGLESREPPYRTHVDGASSTSRTSTTPSHPSKSLSGVPTSASIPTIQSSANDIESMKHRIRQLEEQLSKTTPISTQPHTLNSSIEISTSGIGGSFHIHEESRSAGPRQAIARSVMHKTRLFGPSHWINEVALFRDILEAMDPYVRDERSKAASGIQRCKALARVIKSQRAPPWPTPPKTGIPSKDVADELVDCYLRTIEPIYRVLHVPNFRKEYEALWSSDTEPETGFLVQLKLVLAIGATTYDEHFSLRTLATQWIYEAHSWLSEPEFKSRLSIQSLQTNLLLLFARETAGIGGSLIWISVGSLLRMAVHMGLHRDPVRLHKRTMYAAEMRRRIWNTILEVNLQSSISSGGPLLVSLDDFDTNPPGNFDDDQLVTEDPAPQSENEFTQTSITIALRKTLPLRLAITKFLNDLSSHRTYEETLQLDAEFKETYKALRRTLQNCKSHTGASPSQFEIRVVDLHMHRYHSALHQPYFDQALQETAFAYSRKVVVETSLKIWCAVHPSSSITAAQSRSNVTLSERDDLARLTICGAGFSRRVTHQAGCLLAIELRAQVQEEDSLGPVPLRPDLLSVLEETRSWAMQCIQAGETNIKCYLLLSLITTQVDGLMRGLRKDELPALLVKTAEDVEDECLPILQEKAAESQKEGTVDGLDQMSLNVASETMEDWDFMMPVDLYNSGNMEQMSWLFDNKKMPGFSLW